MVLRDAAAVPVAAAEAERSGCCSEHAMLTCAATAAVAFAAAPATTTRERRMRWRRRPSRVVRGARPKRDDRQRQRLPADAVRERRRATARVRVVRESVLLRLQLVL